MDDFQADFMLMCRNAQTYNIEGSIVSWLNFSMLMYWVLVETLYDISFFYVVQKIYPIIIYIFLFLLCLDLRWFDSFAGKWDKSFRHTFALSELRLWITCGLISMQVGQKCQVH